MPAGLYRTDCGAAKQTDSQSSHMRERHERANSLLCGPSGAAPADGWARASGSGRQG